MIISIAFLTSCASSRMGASMADRDGYAKQESPSNAPESASGMYEPMKKAKDRKERAIGGKSDSGKEPTSSDQELQQKKSDRMVIYFAGYKIEVESVKQAMAEINSITSRLEGFIESAVTSDSYRYSKVVLRVPVKRFDEALKLIERLGEVTGREVSASDVTMEFNDISLRLETSKRVRARMYELLKRVKKVDERVKILREIERLNNIIESFTTQINYLKSRASYSTVTLELKSKVRDVVRRYIPSPFHWIAGLNHENRSMFDDGGDIKFDRPDGFFSLAKDFYDRKNPYLLQTPDNSTRFRIGVTDNYPPADLKFWEDAFNIDIKNRMYKVDLNDEIRANSGLVFRRYSIKLNDNSIYMIAFAVSDKRIMVMESLFQNDAVFKKHRESAEKFIKSAGLK
jgi:hypothetical protein